MKHSHSTTAFSKHTKAELLQVKNPVNQRLLKDFTHQVFSHQYQADIQEFLPNMLALLDKQQHIHASVCFQSAQGTKLHLEHYLAHSIEHCIARHMAIQTPDRNSILEVGNLASQNSGSTRRLIIGLANHFYQQNFKWLVITATPQVINSFEKLSLQASIHSLADASPDAVASTPNHWGSYYQQAPSVYAIDIEAGLKHLHSNAVFSRMLTRTGPVVCDDNIFLQTAEASS